ncbi:hypothetical protein QPL79_05855 [Ignisphaera sp. 4213-co]|uniref:Apea-like HEPN domain-containing protein n=1 Tax=Ignisphaera cupida TaxID=3050454 RepID=A0ABD4Z6D0_9CREN|nr:hypothetical protein [Ignisphaera sp. 4213-co]MDK6028882.1 hypothetical protein [Ignisphaera sp. 4213-co]
MTMYLNMDLFDANAFTHYFSKSLDKYFNEFQDDIFKNMLGIDLTEMVKELLPQIDLSSLCKVFDFNEMNLDLSKVFLLYGKLAIVNERIVTCFADYIERPLRFYVLKQYSKLNNKSFNGMLKKLIEKSDITENGMKSLQKIYRIRCKRAHGEHLTFEDLTELLEELANLNGTELEKKLRNEFEKCLWSINFPSYIFLSQDL